MGEVSTAQKKHQISRNELTKKKKTLMFSAKYSVHTLILRILSVNLELNSKTSVGDMVLVFGSLLRILYLAQESECSKRITSSSVKFSCAIISE